MKKTIVTVTFELKDADKETVYTIIDRMAGDNLRPNEAYCIVDIEDIEE
jgi:hypothetical protein